MDRDTSRVRRLSAGKALWDRGGVSVVIPAVSSAYLGECLQSLVGQTFENWQAIVVADGYDHECIQGEVDVLSDSRFSIINNVVNSGPGASRNIAIRRANTEWVAVVDSDDVLSPRFLETLLDVALATPRADAFFGDFEWIGDRTGRLRWGAQDLGEFLTSRSIPGAGVVYRRAVWERAGGYCEADVVRMAGIDDFEFWLKALKTGVRVGHVDEVLYFYRRHEGSLMTTPNPRYHLAREYVYSLHRESFDCYSAGGRYVADGYWRSVADSFRLDRRMEALAHAFKAVGAGRSAVDVAKLVLLSIACALRSELPHRLRW
jgi:glycosyltransferase involved in cell wall biosynthesis